jgi:acetylornithine deacetylase/succinyl-diaminopimelate desuccinylase-like protein
VGNTEQSPPYPQATELLQRLIRCDTTNPPGNEILCIQILDDVLRDAGFETQILGSDENRPNLVTRLAGQGQAPPLLMYGHVDVVTTKGQSWTHPPFEARVADGYIWGRGVLDMKGPVVVMVSTLLRAKAEGFEPPGDVVLAVVSDEEAGGRCGAGYLVEEQRHLFHGIRYAIGEAGGISVHMGGKRIYPIMVAEKQGCAVSATVRGRGGHGAIPVRGETMSRLASMLQKLDRSRLPVHITTTTRQMIESFATALPAAQGLVLRLLLIPWLTDRILDLLGSAGQTFDPLLHNTASPTMVRASEKINVVPSQATVQLDGRLLPGHNAEDLLCELGRILGDEVELEVLAFNPGPPEPDMGLFDTLGDILREADPAAIVGPMLLAGVTDARHFARLGIQTYGFTPMQLPAELDPWQMVHGADERLPLSALPFGIDATYKLLQRFGQVA